MVSVTEASVLSRSWSNYITFMKITTPGSFTPPWITWGYEGKGVGRRGYVRDGKKRGREGETVGDVGTVMG